MLGLNAAIREATIALREAAAENPNAGVLVHAATFSDGARWHCATSTPVSDFRWADVRAGGARGMGKALAMAAAQLTAPPMPEHALCPVLVLSSDGGPTDDVAAGLSDLLHAPFRGRAVRLAVPIGNRLTSRFFKSSLEILISHS